MICLSQGGTMKVEPPTYPGYRFPAEIISHAVWLYHVFSLSLRDVELILAERGITVTHESIRHWCLKFGPDFARKLRRHRPKPGDIWHLDEVFLHINGVLPPCRMDRRCGCIEPYPCLGSRDAEVRRMSEV
jgi:putative transposase